jgi:hypothetical protein
MQNTNLYTPDCDEQPASRSLSTSPMRSTETVDSVRDVDAFIDSRSQSFDTVVSPSCGPEPRVLFDDICRFIRRDQQVAYSIHVQLGHRQRPEHAVGDAALAAATTMYTLQLLGARCGGYYVLQHVSIRGPGHGLYTPSMSCLVIARNKMREPSRQHTSTRIRRALARDLGPNDVSILVSEFELTETEIRQQLSVMYTSYTFPDAESMLVQRALAQRTCVHETWAETIGNCRSRVFVLASLACR